MSVDVFGRKLNKKEGSRGPPGVGYKITADGQLDADDKRICNLAYPTQPSDAVNLYFITQLLDAELRSIKTTISQLQKNITDLKALVIQKQQQQEPLLHNTITRELKRKKNGTSSSSGGVTQISTTQLSTSKI